jgi:hypothetical protein
MHPSTRRGPTAHRPPFFLAREVRRCYFCQLHSSLHINRQQEVSNIALIRVLRYVVERWGVFCWQSKCNSYAVTR